MIPDDPDRPPDPGSESGLTVDELLRYGRHIKTPEIGPDGQARLKNSSALIVGLGGLGCTSALHLAAAGVGRLTLVDFDAVELGNIHRQVLHWTSDVGRPKLESAAEKIAEINPLVSVGLRNERLSPENSKTLVEGHDIVVDGTDNLPARYSICDACVSADIPHVYGAVSRFEGRIAVFDSRSGPCYRCMHPHHPTEEEIPDCADLGVVGPVPGVIGAFQAVEAIKWLTGLGTRMVGKLMLIDMLTMAVRTLEIAKNPDCSVCSRR